MVTRIMTPSTIKVDTGKITKAMHGWKVILMQAMRCMYVLLMLHAALRV